MFRCERMSYFLGDGWTNSSQRASCYHKQRIYVFFDSWPLNIIVGSFPQIETFTSKAASDSSIWWAFAMESWYWRLNRLDQSNLWSGIDSYRQQDHLSRARRFHRDCLRVDVNLAVEWDEIEIKISSVPLYNEVRSSRWEASNAWY